MYRTDQYVRIIDNNLKCFNQIGQIEDIQVKLIIIRLTDDNRVVLNQNQISPFRVLKVGDSVQVLPTIKYQKEIYANNTPLHQVNTTREMIELHGLKATIKRIFPGYMYHIEGGQSWYWSNDLLIPLETQNLIDIF